MLFAQRSDSHEAAEAGRCKRRGARSPLSLYGKRGLEFRVIVVNFIAMVPGRFGKNDLKGSTQPSPRERSERFADKSSVP
jgi:hypothetical protein